MIVRLSLSGEILLFCFFIKFAENQCCYGTNEVLSCGNPEGCVKLKKSRLTERNPTNLKQIKGLIISK
jgi:hypothetical protein